MVYSQSFNPHSDTLRKAIIISFRFADGDTEARRRSHTSRRVRLLAVEPSVVLHSSCPVVLWEEGDENHRRREQN